MFILTTVSETQVGEIADYCDAIREAHAAVNRTGLPVIIRSTDAIDNWRLKLSPLPMPTEA